MNTRVYHTPIIYIYKMYPSNCVHPSRFGKHFLSPPWFISPGAAGAALGAALGRGFETALLDPKAQRRPGWVIVWGADWYLRCFLIKKAYKIYEHFRNIYVTCIYIYITHIIWITYIYIAPSSIQLGFLIGVAWEQYGNGDPISQGVPINSIDLAKILVEGCSHCCSVGNEGMGWWLIVVVIPLFPAKQQKLCFLHFHYTSMLYCLRIWPTSPKKIWFRTQLLRLYWQNPRTY